MGDQIFPFPEPEWLFVHTVHIGARDAVVTQPDGRWEHVVVETPARGYLTAPDPQEVSGGNTEVVVIDAVLLVSNSTVVREQDRVRADDPTIPPVLTGVFAVVGVRPNQSHTRVLLSRVKREPLPRGG